MNLKKHLQGHIQGGLPKERNPPSNTLKAAEAPSKALKVLRYVGVIAVLSLIVVLVVTVYMPFIAENVVTRLVATVIYAGVAVAFYFAYGREYYKRHPKESRRVFVLCSGLFCGIAIPAIAVGILGRPLLFPSSLLLFFTLVGAGAFIGDKVGKKAGLY